jgi:hypothetical protein
MVRVDNPSFFKSDTKEIIVTSVVLVISLIPFVVRKFRYLIKSLLYDSRVLCDSPFSTVQ